MRTPKGECGWKRRGLTLTRVRKERQRDDQRKLLAPNREGSSSEGQCGLGIWHRVNPVSLLPPLSTGPVAISQHQAPTRPCGPILATTEVCRAYSMEVTLAKQVSTLRLSTQEMHLQGEIEVLSYLGRFMTLLILTPVTVNGCDAAKL